MSRHRHADNQTTGTRRVNRRSAKPSGNINMPRDCARVRATLPAFLDGELDHDAHRAMQRHLDDCVDCHREWNEHRKAEQILQTAHRNIPDPGDLRAGFYARLAATSPGHRPTLAAMLRRAAFPALAVTALAMTLLLVTPKWFLPWYGNHRGYSRGYNSGMPDSNSPIAGVPSRGAPNTIVTQQVQREDKRSSPADQFTANHAEITPLTGAGNMKQLGSSVDMQRFLMITTAAGSTAPPIRLRVARRIEPAGNRLPQIKLPTFKSIGMVAMYSDNMYTDDTDAIPMKAALPPKPVARQMTSISDSLVANANVASSFNGNSIGVTRAELMNEEVHIHIVNDRNEEVDSVQIAPGTANATDASVVHVEADAKQDGDGAQAERN